MAGAQDILALSKKYNGFTKPQYSFKINGTEVDEKFCNQEIEVELCAGYEASYAKISIRNAFLRDDKKPEIFTEKELQSVLKLGNTIQIFMGYAAERKADMTEVFSGYIDAIYLEYEHGDEVVYFIECLDGKGIMMNSLHSETKKSVKKLSLAAEDVLKKYSSVIKIDGQGIDKGDEEVKMPIEQHNESDYDFVVRLAKKLNYDFYINAGKLYYRSVKKRDRNVTMKYHINEYIKHFEFRFSLKDVVKSVTVRTNDETDPTKIFEGTATGYSNSVENGNVTAGSVSKLLTDRNAKTILDYSVSSVSEAKERAEAELTAEAFFLGSGHVLTPGIPELFPGSVVEVEGFGELYDRKYYVTKVKHRIKHNHFTTRCEIEVNKF